MLSFLSAVSFVLVPSRKKVQEIPFFARVLLGFVCCTRWHKSEGWGVADKGSINTQGVGLLGRVMTSFGLNVLFLVYGGGQSRGQTAVEGYHIFCGGGSGDTAVTCRRYALSRFFPIRCIDCCFRFAFGFVRFRLVSFGFVPFRSVSFGFVTFRCISLRLVSYRLVWFGLVSTSWFDRLSRNTLGTRKEYVRNVTIQWGASFLDITHTFVDCVATVHAERDKKRLLATTDGILVLIVAVAVVPVSAPATLRRDTLLLLTL